MRRAQATALVALAALLGACATVNEAPVEDRSTSLAAARGAPGSANEHVVVAGDTLYGVAFRHDLDYRRLAAWNDIASPYTIRPGQRLRLTPPPAPPGAPAAASVASPAQPAFDGTTQTYAAGDAAVSSAAPLQVEPLAAEPLVPAPAPTAPSAAPPPARPAPAPGPVSAAIGAGGAEASPARTPSQPPPTPAPTTSTPPPRPSAAPAPTPAAAAPPLAIAKAPTQTVGGVAWRWPTDGRVANRYVAGDPARQGVDILGREGQSITAAADGEVVYSGNGLLGYGELVIIKHSGDFLSAYGHNRRRLVAEGTRVRAGQPIAEMGKAGGLERLHFEIRRDGKPVDPLAYLPRR